MILLQHKKAALVLKIDLKGGQILNGSNWTGLNSTLSRCTWEATWTQNKVQVASKSSRTFHLTRRTSIFRRCFLDNSVKKNTHPSEQSMERVQDTSLTPLFCLPNFLFQIRREYPKEEKLSSNAVWKGMCNTSPPSICQPCCSWCFPHIVANPETLIQDILLCYIYTYLEACWKPVLLLHLSLICSIVFSSTTSIREKGAEIIGS